MYLGSKTITLPCVALEASHAFEVSFVFLSVVFIVFCYFCFRLQRYGFLAKHTRVQAKINLLYYNLCLCEQLRVAAGVCKCKNQIVVILPPY